ncbi:hypothetical protein [Metabacillus dongyingensis]|uniref:hypothetical protein n=1 Tax=Metabacillus dongyingensis TaxID=2874282 RepID=UPI001FB1EAD2|nr:hypothetical protein [Metabacillus dongyingensis]UNJ81298.1 hypothetical protein [Metabacillus dongyingensis]
MAGFTKRCVVWTAISKREDVFKEIYVRWKAGEMKAVKAMGELGVKKTTFYKLVKENQNR